MAATIENAYAPSRQWWQGTDILTGGNPYTANFFQQDLAQSYASARLIVPILRELAAIHSVLDAGCGTGSFLRAFVEAGIADVMGIDGDYVPRDQLAIDPARFRAIDLARGFSLGRRYDLVVSLEVAEHLPQTAAELFVVSLAAHGALILFSAAIPAQGGTGHVNEQWPSYWAALFARHGYAAYDVIRPLIWQDPEVCWWYQQNTILYAQADAAARHPAIARLQPTPSRALDIVHPLLYVGRLRGK